MSRVWGEDSSLLAEAGLDVGRLADLEAETPRAVNRVVDAHVHLGRDVDGHELAADGLGADLDRWGIAAAVCFPASQPGPDRQFHDANAMVRDAASADSRLTPFCRLDPSAPGWEAELEACCRSGVRGLKLHPVAQSFRPESPESCAAVAAASEAGLPVLFHAGFGARRLAEPFAALRASVPDARLILAHGGRGDARALLDVFRGDDRLLFDTSLATLTDLVEIPPAQLCFGSDRPYGDYATAVDLVRRAARRAEWTATQQDAVWAGNIEAWLS